ncbi:MAG: WD40-like beta Propeller containing protein [Gemmatimonadetes bacterium]|nr:WD40-like beta Propeller containing protein [Gemmatimonadota bacterium]
MRSPTICGALAALLLAAPLAAQDTTGRGVRIGLSYDPGSKPGVVVLPVTGARGDSIRAILQRDLDYGDRVNVIVLDAASVRDAARAAGPNWALLARLGAAAAVQVTPTAAGFHIAVFNVATKQTALVKDYATSAQEGSRAWRAALHGVSDELEEAFTGTRGIARTRVLFERGKRIWVVDSDGDGAMPLTEVGTPVSAAWHPSGRTIAYSSYLPAAISLFDLTTNRSRTIASGSGVYISPVFTPDGTNVVYAHGTDEGVDLYIAPLSGGGGRRLSVGRGSDNVSPSFSPDGRRIVFMSGRAGHPEIYTMDADGTNVDLLTPLEFGENAYRASPDWSPDGRLVAFQSQMAGTFQILTINLRDRSLKQLTSDGRNEDPSWGPDGRHLTFVSNRTGAKQLWVLDIETGRTRQLTRGPAVRLPAWSPRLSID